VLAASTAIACFALHLCSESLDFEGRFFALLSALQTIKFLFPNFKRQNGRCLLNQ
jgi:hypothetical protein